MRRLGDRTKASLDLITFLFPVRLTHGTVVLSGQLVDLDVSGRGKVELQDWVVEEVGRHLHGEVGDEGFPG